MFSGASNITNEVDRIFLIIIGTSVFLLVFITILMVYFVFRYNRKRHAKAAKIKETLMLEIIWTAVPTILVMGLFYYGYVGYRLMRNVPADHITIKVIGQMWFWKFEYPNGVKTDELFVPVDKAVELSITSMDVNHSFYIPAFRIKHDAIPGTVNYIWFVAEEEGDYDAFCAEYCGLQHAYMLTKVHVLNKEAYGDWYRDLESQAASEVKGASPSLAVESPVSK